MLWVGIHLYNLTSSYHPHFLRSHLYTHVRVNVTFLQTEEVTRNSLRHVAESWLESCINFDAMFAAHMMPYAVQPNVMNGMYMIFIFVLSLQGLRPCVQW